MDIHEMYELHREFTWDYLTAVRDKVPYELPIRKISPSMYKRALQDYMMFGKVTRYPEKIIYRWKRYIITNTMFLEAMTDIGGHSSIFPYDELNDIFFSEEEEHKHISTYEEVCTLFAHYEEDDRFPLWSNGQYMLSDYGIKPLCEICLELGKTSDCTEILKLIDKALNVVHERSDLAELFIHGGSKSLTEITNYG